MASNAGDTIANNVSTTSTIAISGKPSGRGRENGFVNSESDQDWFRITLDAGELYEFSLRDRGNTPLDSTLTLRDAAGLQIAFDDDSGAGDNGRLLFRSPTAGTYYLDVGGFSTSTGGYQLTASEVPATIGTFSSVLVNGSTTGVIGSANDQDFHSILLAAGESYIFDVTGAIDSTLSLRDGAGTELLFNDDDGGDGNARIEFTAAGTGTFYLDVGGFSSGTGAYTLAARIDDAADDIQTTDVLSVGGSRNGTINTGADQDFFRVSLTQGQNYVFRATGVGDETVTLRGFTGTQLAFDDDSGPGNDAQLAFTPTSSGTYFVDVGSFADNVGAYTVSALFA